MDHGVSGILDFFSEVAAENDEHQGKNKQPNHNPHGNLSLEFGVVLLVVEKGHGEPAAESSAYPGHPKQDGIRNPFFAFMIMMVVMGPLSVYAIQDKSDDVDDEQIGRKYDYNVGHNVTFQEKPRQVSGVVEHNGVEPMTSCMPCKRSSQLS